MKKLGTLSLPLLFILLLLISPAYAQVDPTPVYGASLICDGCNPLSFCEPVTSDWFQTRITFEVNQEVNFHCCSDAWEYAEWEFEGSNLTGLVTVENQYEGVTTYWSSPGIYTVMVGRNLQDMWTFRVEVTPSVPSAELVLYYSFDSDSEPGFDDSGNGHDGVVGAATVNSFGAPYNTGSSLYFDPENGVDDFLTADTDDLDICDLNGPMTGMAWIRPHGDHDPNTGEFQGTIFSKGGNYWFQVQQDNSGIMVQNEGSGVHYALVAVPGGIPVNKWTHVAFTRSIFACNGVEWEFRIYVNGEYIGSDYVDAASAFTPNNKPLTVGNYGFYGPGDCQFNGDIDEIKIFTSCMDDRAIQLEYERMPMSIQYGAKYVIEGASNGTDYSWWIDVDQDGVGIASEPHELNVVGIPAGRGPSALAAAFAASINGWASSGVQATYNGNTLNINRGGNPAFNLYVGPSGENPPACNANTGSCSFNPVITLVAADASAVDDALPGRTTLLGAYPNPFNPTVSVAFAMAEPGRAKLEIYDMAGRVIAILVDELLSAGPHEVVWNGRDMTGQHVASGVYMYRLESGETVQTKRITLLK